MRERFNGFKQTTIITWALKIIIEEQIKIIISLGKYSVTLKSTCYILANEIEIWIT